MFSAMYTEKLYFTDSTSNIITFDLTIYSFYGYVRDLIYLALCVTGSNVHICVV